MKEGRGEERSEGRKGRRKEKVKEGRKEKKSEGRKGRRKE